MSDELDVYLAGRHIATLTSTSNRRVVELTWSQEADVGDMRLSESFVQIVGLSPDRQRLSRFLGGYLPEGQQRAAMAKHRGIATDDLFGFLREYGGSLAGALAFRKADDQPHYELLTPKKLARAFREASARWNQGLRDDSRSMIPGFQPKVLVTKLDDGRWYQPHGGAHSTHILKPPRKDAVARLYDEFYAHELARHMGLASFHSEIRKVAGESYLAIERYDRRQRGGVVEVIHQEDAAQALGLDWTSDAVKFQNQDRPNDRSHASAGAIAEALVALDGDPLQGWLRQLTFRLLIGDNDGHAKNVSIMHLPGEDRLADLYDAVPNLFQSGRVDFTLALSVNRVFDHHNLTKDHLEREAAAWGGLNPRAISATVDDVFGRFEAALEAVPFPHQGSPDVVAALRRTLERLRAGKTIGQYA